MSAPVLQAGDRVLWHRGDKPVHAVVLRITEGGHRACVQYVDQRWCGAADLELIDSRYPPAEDSPG